METKYYRLLIPKILFLLIFGLGTCFQAGAQFFNYPTASPYAEVLQRVGITDVEVTYSRPSVNGREIFGGLVSWEQVWRAGANENTTVSFSTDVTVEGQSLAAGTYGLHMIPREKGDWTVIFSRDHKSWGSFSYDEGNDALRINVSPRPLDQPVEMLTYLFRDIDMNSAILEMAWADRAILIGIEVNTQAEMFAHIQEVMMGLAQFNNQAYINAAQYLLANDYKLEQALEWVNYSIDGYFGAEESFDNLMLKANILESMDRAGEAEKIRGQAINHPTASPVDVYGFGRQMINADRPEEGMRIMKMNLERHPGNWIALHGMARAHSALGNFDKAVEYEEMALEKAVDEASIQAMKAYLERLKRGEDIN